MRLCCRGIVVYELLQSDFWLINYDQSVSYEYRAVVTLLYVGASSYCLANDCLDAQLVVCLGHDQNTTTSYKHLAIVTNRNLLVLISFFPDPFHQ